MKKALSIVLVFLMLAALLAGCNQKKTETNTPASQPSSAENPSADKKPLTQELVDAAADLVYEFNKPGANNVVASDFTLPSKVVDYEGYDMDIRWTADGGNGLVTVEPGEDKTTVKVDRHADEDTEFTMKGTVSCGEFSKEISFKYVIKKSIKDEDVVKMAYDLAENEVLEGTWVLTGKIVSVDTPYDAGYANVTVTIVVGDLTDKPIQCYRLKGTGADTIKKGDVITVEGTLKNYKGKPEFDQGCKLLSIDEVAQLTNAEKIEAELAKLSLPTFAGESQTLDLPGTGATYADVTFNWTSSDEAHAKIENGKLVLTIPEDMVEVVVTVEGKCGDASASKAFTIKLKNGEMTPEDILNALYALNPGESLDGTYKLSGKITSVKTAFDPAYNNVTVIIQVGDFADKPVTCYRLKGTGADLIKKDDVITVEGTLTNYNGTFEFTQGCTLVSIDSVAQLTDKEKVETEIGRLSLPSMVAEATELTLPKTGAQYEDVVFTWTTNNATLAKIDGDKLQLTIGNENVDVTVTVNAVCGSETGSKTFTVKLTAHELTMEEIVNSAYALDTGAALDGSYTLTGKVTKVNTAYDANYGNVTVTIVVGNLTDKPIQCFRMKGDDAATVKAGDTITVTGKLKNYNGTVEFDVGCILDQINEVGPDVPPAPTPTTTAEIMEALYKLQDGETLDGKFTLTGKVTKIDTAFSAQYNNVSVVVEIDGYADKPVTFYRMSGTGADTVKVGDTVTATGPLKNYKGTYELNVCTLDKLVPGQGGQVDPPTPGLKTEKEIVDAAYALEGGAKLDRSYTLTGKVTSIDTAYASQYGNVTVTIVVGDMTDKPIKCFRLKNGSAITAGAGVEVVKVGDTVTVSGILVNYVKDDVSTIEFDAGCTLDKLVNGGGQVDPPAPTPTTTAEIMEALYKLNDNEVLEGKYTLTGKVTRIDTAFSTQYNNVSVTVQIDGYPDKPVMFYRLAGTGADTVKVGDTVTATGPLKNYKGTYELNVCTLDRLVPGQGGQVDPPQPGEYKTAKEIYEAAVAAGDGKALSGTYTLTGVVKKISYTYTAANGVTLDIEVDGYVFNCYKMQGTDAPEVKITDTITVTGTIKNYRGTIEFDTGCTLVRIDQAGVLPEGLKTPEEIVNAAYALEAGATLDRKYTLTGKVISVDTAYDASYGNVTVTIVVGDMTDKPIMCYRVAGTGADVVKVGDTITVTGILTNYVKNDKSTIEFTQGCTLDSLNAGELSDAEMIAYEIAKVSIPSSVSRETAVDLPASGSTYPVVKFTYTSSDSILAAISGSKLTLKPASETKTVTVTVKATCNAASDTKTFTVTLKVSSGVNTTDALNHNNTIATVLTPDDKVTFYKDYTVTGESGAVYAANTAGDKESIQIRTTNNNSGIVVTTSAGKVKSVTITFHADTAAARVIEVYGKNTAYTSAADLYGDAKGTLIGTIAKSDPQMLTISGDYEYIGLRSKTGACYVESIEIVWAD